MAHPESSPSPSLDEEKKASLDAVPIEPLASGNVKKSWFRSVLFQIVVVGMTSFLSPGFWNAMNGLGAAGGQNPTLSNGANSLVFSMMVVSCIFSSAIVDRVGYRYALILGAVGYPLYAGGLVYNLNSGNSWLVWLGSVACGASAGLFWGVEAAIVMGYPSAQTRGRYLALWTAFGQLGSVVGGSISLALNAGNGDAGSVTNTTYYVFIALQCVAPIVALFLSEPAQVQRSDNTPVAMDSHIGVKRELTEMWKVIVRPEILLLVPIVLRTEWPGSFAGTFEAVYLSVRARSLASLLTALLDMLVAALLGFFLDAQALSKKTRARGSFLFIQALFGGVWVWFSVLQVRYLKNPPLYDWSDRGFGAPFAVFLMYQICYITLRNYLYWLAIQLARTPSDLLRLSAFLRGLESVGSAFGYGISASSVPYTVPLGVNFGMWALGGAAAWWVVREVKEGGRYEGGEGEK
ncbi:hypothetical protein JCM8097_000265 [Rhodosporidiobolus ruineniae]